MYINLKLCVMLWSPDRIKLYFFRRTTSSNTTLSTIPLWNKCCM